MKKLLVILIVIMIGGESFGQFSRDLLHVEHTYSANEESLDYNATDVKINLPLKLGKGFLINTIGFNQSILTYNQEHDFNTSEIDRFYQINYSLGYSYPLNKGWGITARLSSGISSNLGGSLESEDVLITGGVYASKRWGTLKSGSNLTFGLAYVTLSGKPGVIPFINFRHIINEQISYGLGFPNTFVKYRLNKKHDFTVGLKTQGFYGNITGNNAPTIDGIVAEKAQFRNFAANLKYTYGLTDLWKLDFNAGYSIHNEYKLLDIDKNEIYDFDLDSRLFFSVGVSYDISSKIKQKRAKEKDK
ncbi:DUF6268 family outer membrane beta-barrel protein [Aquimarina rhabdastrellae]